MTKAITKYYLFQISFGKSRTSRGKEKTRGGEKEKKTDQKH